MTIAAIDIGSNAARILITDVKTGVDNSVSFEKLNLIRIPLRLGFDVFEKGQIGGKKRKMLLETVKAFKQVMKVYDVDNYIACATSAMRDASNSKDIIKEIKAETSIDIDVISGDLEASILFETHTSAIKSDAETFLMIDVGGGSTELTLYHDAEIYFQHSYNIGTIRLLTNKVKKHEWDDMQQDVKQIAKAHPGIVAIGSGGNINKLLSISRLENKISSMELNKYYNELSSLSVSDRITKYGLKADRADVIVPALSIYAAILKWGNIDEIQVPKLGLVDGLIQHLYSTIAQKKS